MPDDQEVRWDHYDTAFHHPSTPVSERAWMEDGAIKPVTWLHPDDDVTPLPDSRWY